MLLPLLLLSLQFATYTVFSYLGLYMQPKHLLADGSGMKYGVLPSGLVWQSSGELFSGGCTPINQSITECYELKLSGDANAQLDPKHLQSPRQRIEFRSPGDAEDGSSWLYTWNSYNPSSLNSTNTFFHLLQVFSRADNGPVYFLDILRNKNAIFKNFITNTTLATVPITKVLDTTLHHRMEVTYGPEGSIDYTLSYKNKNKDKDSTDSEIMHVQAQGYTGTGGCYIKFGMYRRTWEGMGPAVSWYGDYTEQRLN